MDEKVFIDVCLNEYRDLKLKNKEEEWLRNFLSSYVKMKDGYEEISSRPSPEVSEIIGEIRERRFVINWLEGVKTSHSDPAYCSAFEYAIKTIEKGDHI